MGLLPCLGSMVGNWSEMLKAGELAQQAVSLGRLEPSLALRGHDTHLHHQGDIWPCSSRSPSQLVSIDWGQAVDRIQTKAVLLCRGCTGKIPSQLHPTGSLRTGLLLGLKHRLCCCAGAVQEAGEEAQQGVHNRQLQERLPDVCARPVHRKQ